jgi:hypothetical protein
MTPPPPKSPVPHWTFAAFRQGALQMIPLLPGLAAFGMVAARKVLAGANVGTGGRNGIEKL